MTNYVALLLWSTDSKQDYLFYFYLQDAFEAFEKQVCVSNYPGRDTPAYDMANGAMSILDRMMRYLVPRL